VNAEYKDGRVSFSFPDLLEKMSTDDKLELIECLSCDDAIVTFVGQQIIDKWTERGYYSSYPNTATSTPHHGLDKVWRDVAKASGDVAKREIERLEKAVESANELEQRGWDEYHKIAHLRNGGQA